MTALFSEAAYEYDVIKWRPLTAVLPALSTGLSILALKRIDNAYPEMVICGIGFALIFWLGVLGFIPSFIGG